MCSPPLPSSQPAKPTQAYAVCETEQWGVDGTNLSLWAPNWMAALVCSISARRDPPSGQRQLSKIQTCSTNRNVGLIRVEEEPSTGGRRTTGASEDGGDIPCRQMGKCVNPPATASPLWISAL